MKTNFRNSESGQAIVLLVLTMIVLLGFTALAVDGSLVYSDRRWEQNAADAASLAGGGEVAINLENDDVRHGLANFCSDSDVIAAQAAAKTTAINRASDNDFSINLTAADDGTSDQGNVSTSCHVDDYITWKDEYIDVFTSITHDTQTAFAHFVFGGPLRNTVQAVTRVRPRTAVAFGYAVVALREDCPTSNKGGVHLRGNDEIQVSGGGIFSNACLVKDGGSDTLVTDGTIGCTGTGCFTDNGASGSIVPPPDEGQVPIPKNSWYIPPPTSDCASLPSFGNHTGGGTISEGRYTQIRVNAAGQNLVMNPGLYCVGSITFNGGTVTGSDITIYLTTGGYTVQGNPVIHLDAPPNNYDECTMCPEALPGVLMYMAPGNTSTIILGGSSDSTYYGLVYAPDGTVDAGGTTAITAINSQIVADTVNLYGTADIEVVYQDLLNYWIPAMLELNE